MLSCFLYPEFFYIPSYVLYFFQRRFVLYFKKINCSVLRLNQVLILKFLGQLSGNHSLIAHLKSGKKKYQLLLICKMIFLQEGSRETTLQKELVRFAFPLDLEFQRLLISGSLKTKIPNFPIFPPFHRIYLLKTKFTVECTFNYL